MSAFFPSWVIVKRELLTALRRDRSLIYVVITVIPTMTWIYLIWPKSGIDMVHDPGYAANMTQDILGWYAVTLLGICGLLTPAFAAASVSYERDTDTLDLLRTTMISRAGLIFAKLWSSAGLFLLIALASVPVVGSLFFATGLDWVQLLAIGVTVLITTLTWASVGLACASRVRNFIIALALTYAIVFVVSGLPETILASTLSNWRRGLLDYATTTAYKLHVFWVFPPIVIVGLLTEQFTWEKYWIFLFGQALIGVPAFFWAVWVIGREREVRKQRNEKPIDDATALAARRKQFPYYLLDPLRRTESISDRANPMRVRELRWGLLGMQTRIIRAMYASMAVFMVLGIIAYGPDGVYMWFMLAMMLCAIVAPPFLIPTFARDLQRGTLDALRSTLLRPRQVILGKFAAGLATMVPLLIGIFAASLILLGANLFFGEQVGNFFTGYGTLIVSVVLVVSVCLLVSQFTRKTASAFAMAYFIVLVLFGGLWFGGLYATKWTTRAITPEQVEPDRYSQLARVRIPERYYENVELYAQAWQFVSPLGAYGGVCDKTYYVERPPDRDVSLGQAVKLKRSTRWGYYVYMWQLPSPLLMWSVSMAGFGLVSWLFVRMSIWRFSKVGVRDP